MSGTKDGVDAFQCSLFKILRQYDLCLKDQQWVSLESLGAHPDNREKAGLVPIDVHDLLLLIWNLGWNWDKVDVVVCQVPPGEVGEGWRAFNKELADKSDNLLARCKPDLLEFMTARGSHTSAAARIMKFGARGVHSELCDANNMISIAKMLEARPSLQEPLDKGLPVVVIRHEIVTAVPTLMEILSQTGNTAHGVGRVQTIMQSLTRVHSLMCTYPDRDVEQIARAAASGRAPGYEKETKVHAQFCLKHSGGKDGRNLQEATDFEKTLTVKRSVRTEDIRSLSELDESFVYEAPLYTTAMLKLLISSPIHEQGVSTIFNSGDYNKLKEKLRPYAISASDYMSKARSFFTAYGQLTPTEYHKLVDELDTRLVMHVHGKRVDTRKSFPSQLACVRASYDEAQRMLHWPAPPNARAFLPIWPVVAGGDGLSDASIGGASESKGTSMTETNRDGKINDKVLIDKGFTIGGVVVNTCRIEELAEGEHSYVIEHITDTTVDMHTQAYKKSKI